MDKKRIVVALGRNSFGETFPEQQENVKKAAAAIADLVEEKYQIVITHSNGPQVGMIQNAFAAAHDAIGTPEMPLPECGAMSQGYIGYHLQQGIGREMHKRYKRWHAATVVTQIECDPDDPAFKNPTKPIGPFYTEEQAKEFMAEDPSKVFVEDSGRGWRRVVASPDHKKIVEAARQRVHRHRLRWRRHPRRPRLREQGLLQGRSRRHRQGPGRRAAGRGLRRRRSVPADRR